MKIIKSLISLAVTTLLGSFLTCHAQQVQRVYALQDCTLDTSGRLSPDAYFEVMGVKKDTGYSASVKKTDTGVTLIAHQPGATKDWKGRCELSFPVGRLNSSYTFKVVAGLYIPETVTDTKYSATTFENKPVWIAQYVVDERLRHDTYFPTAFVQLASGSGKLAFGIYGDNGAKELELKNSHGQSIDPRGTAFTLTFTYNPQNGVASAEALFPNGEKYSAKIEGVRFNSRPGYDIDIHLGSYSGANTVEYHASVSIYNVAIYGTNQDEDTDRQVKMNDRGKLKWLDEAFINGDYNHIAHYGYNGYNVDYDRY